MKPDEKNPKTAVVIGATGNLGKAVCDALADEGYELDPVWLSRDHPDASKANAYDNLPPKIHLAIYVAGINVIKDTASLSEEDWDRVMDVNLKGAFLFAKNAFEPMKAAGESCFVVISSIMVTHPYPKRLVYVVSKAGLEGLARALAVEWGMFNISTHAIRLGHLEGLMKTTPPSAISLEKVKNHVPSERINKPEDVASYILWLAGGGAKAVSGSVIDFDPAYTINRIPK